MLTKRPRGYSPGIDCRRGIAATCLPFVLQNKAEAIGNGYITAMVFGTTQIELELNESTIWGGGSNITVDSAAKPYINQVRALPAQKKYLEAQQHANKQLATKHRKI